MNPFRPLGEIVNDFHLFIRRLQCDCMPLALRHREVQCISCLHISHLPEKPCELRKVIETTKPCLDSKSVSGKVQFGLALCLSEGRCPRIKMQESEFIKGVILQVFLHRIHLCH